MYHLDWKYKNTTLIEFKVQRTRFDENVILSILNCRPINKSIITACHEVAYLITKQNKTQTFGETVKTGYAEVHKYAGKGDWFYVVSNVFFKWYYQQQNRRHGQSHLNSSSFRSYFKPQRDFKCFQFYPACSIRALYEYRCNKDFILFRLHRITTETADVKDLENGCFMDRSL